MSRRSLPRSRDDAAGYHCADDADWTRRHGGFCFADQFLVERCDRQWRLGTRGLSPVSQRHADRADSLTSASDTGLAEYTSYNYTVRSYDNAGNVSPLSSAVPVRTLDVTPPTVPGTPTTPHQPVPVSLSWTGSTDPGSGSGLAGYKIYRNGVQIGTSATTSYVDSTAQNWVLYRYRVAAYDNGGNTSAQSGELVFQPPDLTPPTTPTNVVATAASSSLVNVTLEQHPPDTRWLRARRLLDLPQWRPVHRRSDRVRATRTTSWRPGPRTPTRSSRPTVPAIFRDCQTYRNGHDAFSRSVGGAGLDQLAELHADRSVLLHWPLLTLSWAAPTQGPAPTRYDLEVMPPFRRYRDQERGQRHFVRGSIRPPTDRSGR